MYWKQVGHVKRSRLPESVTCPLGWDNQTILKNKAIQEGYQYLVFCKPTLVTHTYFKVHCELLYRRDIPILGLGGTQYWNGVWAKFKYSNLKPEILEDKTNSNKEIILESSITINDYSAIPRAHFNNISSVLASVFDYGSEYFTPR